MIMKQIRLLAVLAILLLTSCSNETDTGPVEVRWDRDVCERCAMAVSDRNFAAQIRGGDAGQKQALHKFDDLGCAIIWLDQQTWKDEPAVEIWVNDFNSNDWIDATTASYLRGQRSPMNYGLAAQQSKAPDALNFTEARAHIYAVEKKHKLHKGFIHTTPGESGETMQ